MDLDEKYADLDLGECCRLAEVSFCPYLDVEYRENETYELCLWQDGWQVVTSAKGGTFLRFTDIPRSVLFRKVGGNMYVLLCMKQGRFIGID